MKVGAFLVLAAASDFGVRGVRLEETTQGKSHAGGVAQVVTMLKSMLKKSQDDWKSDQDAYDKFKIYCDTNTEKKTKAVEDSTQTISRLGNKIEALQSTNGDLAIKTADLKLDIADNTKARGDAKAAREKENKAFLKTKKDSEDAIKQINQAIKELAAIGADQTLGKNAAHEKFMAGYKEKSLVSIQSSVRQALMAADVIFAPDQQRNMQAFIQAPVYSAQSSQVVGILKNMRDTFQANLDTAIANEKKAKEAYDKFKKNKEDEHDNMKKSYDGKQANLGTNDGELSTKKVQLQQSTKLKNEDEDFLDKLSVQCTDKARQYEARKTFAQNEEVALNKAISILDNDVASEKFAKVKATKFIQLSAVRHRSTNRKEVTELMKKAVREHYSSRIGKVLSLLQAGNPFNIILKQIDKLISLIDDEQKVDDEQKAWCEKTDKEQKKKLDDKKDDLKTTKDDITKLIAAIADPKSGLKKQIAGAEDSMKTNQKNQAQETKTRRKDNLAYQKDASTMTDTIEMISQAQKVLKDYYDALDNEQLGFIQASPAPPKTFGNKYSGQNLQAKKVLTMLDDIKKATDKEQKTAHDSELKAQHDYEDSMEALTKAESDLEESIAKLNKDLADKEKDLNGKYEDEETSEKEKKTIERYIAKIKPGCNFITAKYNDRKTARGKEKTALAGAKTKLKGSPSYKLAVQKAKEDALGQCKAICLKDSADVKCKACLAGVSVPGYCAGHQGTKGC